jgi:hypothetical protein
MRITVLSRSSLEQKSGVSWSMREDWIICEKKKNFMVEY